MNLRLVLEDLFQPRSLSALASAIAERDGYATLAVEWALRRYADSLLASGALERLRDEASALPSSAHPTSVLVLLARSVPTVALDNVLHAGLLGVPLDLRYPRGLPESPLVEAFRARVSSPAVRRVTYPHDAPELASYDTVVAYGADATLDRIGSRLSPTTNLVRHGHRVSIALLHSRPASLSSYAHALAEDIVAWEQRGCMSPSAILVSSRALADDLLGELLHSAFPAVERCVPPPPSPALALQAAQHQHVGVATFLGASLRRSSTVRLLDYPEPCAHALTTPGGRTVSLVVYPNACALKQFLMPWSERLSTVSAPRVDQGLARALRPFRVCLPGEMQFPRLDAHHDGYPPLARLLRRFT